MRCAPDINWGRVTPDQYPDDEDWGRKCPPQNLAREDMHTKSNTPKWNWSPQHQSYVWYDEDRVLHHGLTPPSAPPQPSFWHREANTLKRESEDVAIDRAYKQAGAEVKKQQMTKSLIARRQASDALASQTRARNEYYEKRAWEDAQIKRSVPLTELRPRSAVASTKATIGRHGGKQMPTQASSKTLGGKSTRVEMGSRATLPYQTASTLNLPTPQSPAEWNALSHQYMHKKAQATRGEAVRKPLVGSLAKPEDLAGYVGGVLDGLSAWLYATTD